MLYKIRLIFICLFFVRVVCAEHYVVKPIPVGEDMIQAVEESEKAPYTGQLFSNDTAIRWMNYIKQYRAYVELLESKLRNAENSKRQSMEILIEGYEKNLTLLEDKYVKVLDENRQLSYTINNPPWYKTFTFGLIIGIVFPVLLFSVMAVASTR